MSADLLNHDVSIVTGAMATALGPDLATSAAAARAGLSRGREVDSFPVTTEDGSIAFVSVHAVDGVTSGLEGSTRLVELGAWVLDDLLAEVTGVSLGRVGLFVALPAPGRIESGGALLPDETELRDRMAPDVVPSQVARDMSQRGASSVGNAKAITRGHAGFGYATRAACIALERGEIDTALFGAVDSLLEDATLDWLAQTGRLKTPNSADGLLPGEAAAFFLARRRSEPLGSIASPFRVTATAVATEEETLIDRGRPLGRGVSAVVEAIAVAGERSGVRATSFSVDHNGERFRSQEWGCALARSCGAYPWLGEAAVEIPAIDHGDTGAAAGAIALGMGLAAHRRPRVNSPHAFGIVGCADDGARSGVLIVSA
jgi:3-oxoacyl-[acyl-carrier-protein] synthase-1